MIYKLIKTSKHRKKYRVFFNRVQNSHDKTNAQNANENDENDEDYVTNTSVPLFSFTGNRKLFYVYFYATFTVDRNFT